MHPTLFSTREGLGPAAAPITIVDGAPRNVREGLLAIAEGELNVSPGSIRSVLCTLLRKMPDPSNWSAYPNIWHECQTLMLHEASWYTVYDFVEALHRTLTTTDPQRAAAWANAVNTFFEQAGVGWRLVDGALERRTSGGAEIAIDRARAALATTSLATARSELDEAVRDLSRRPQPDLTGAVQHAMAALECTVREVTGNHSTTLGALIKQTPSLFPAPMSDVLTKLWGFASERARHLREGGAVEHAEAELIVAVGAAAAAYLTSVCDKQ